MTAAQARGRPARSLASREQSNLRADTLKSWLATTQGWSVKRLAEQLGITRESLSHVVNKRIFCSEEFFEAAAKKMGKPVEQKQFIPVPRDDMIKVLDFVASHEAASQLSSSQRHTLAVELALSLETQGLSAADLPPEEITRHLMIELVKLLSSHWKS